MNFFKFDQVKSTDEGLQNSALIASCDRSCYLFQISAVPCGAVCWEKLVTCSFFVELFHGRPTLLKYLCRKSLAKCSFNGWMLMLLFLVLVKIFSRYLKFVKIPKIFLWIIFRKLVFISLDPSCFFAGLFRVSSGNSFELKWAEKVPIGIRNECFHFEVLKSTLNPIEHQRNVVKRFPPKFKTNFNGKRRLKLRQKEGNVQEAFLCSKRQSELTMRIHNRWMNCREYFRFVFHARLRAALISMELPAEEQIQFASFMFGEELFRVEKENNAYSRSRKHVADF